MISCFVCSNCANIKKRSETENHFNQCIDKEKQFEKMAKIRYDIDRQEKDLVVPRWNLFLFDESKEALVQLMKTNFEFKLI